MASTTLPTFPTTAEVLASLQSALQALNSILTNYNAGGATETYLEAASLLTGSDASTYPGVTQKGAYELLTQVQAAEFILTATGSFLDLKAADVGVERKPAVSAGGPVQFFPTVSSSVAIVVPVGSLVAAESADPTVGPIVYRTLATATIPANGASSNIVQVLAVNAGSLGNQSAIGAINTVVSGATGCTVTSTGTIGGGADQEQDDAPDGGLRARALAAIPNASQCTLSAIEAAAVSYAGITNAIAQDNVTDSTQPLGVVQLYVDDGSGDLGNASNANYPVIATLQNDLNSGKYRAAGVQVFVQGSLLLLVQVSLIVSLNSTYVADVESAADILIAIQNAIQTYVNAVNIGNPVLLSEIIKVVANVPGVSDVPIFSVLINGNAQNLIPGPVQAPRINDPTTTVVTYSLVSY
jgi:uncharacterized phage protein gp47/JayE